MSPPLTFTLSPFSVYRSAPPLTAGKIVISQFSGNVVLSNSLRRTFSSLRKMFTCCRSCPCSFKTRSRRPTCFFHKPSSASPTVAAGASTVIWLWPFVKSVRNPVTLKVIMSRRAMEECLPEPSTGADQLPGGQPVPPDPFPSACVLRQARQP